MSSPSFDSFADPQQGQLSGAAMTTRSRGKWSGNGLREGRLRSNDLTVCVRAAAFSAASSSSVAAASKSSFHLLQQPSLALRAAAVKRPAKLFDLKLEMGDQHFRAGVYRLRASLNGFGFNACGALGDDHRMRAGKIGWQRFRADVTRRQNHIRQQLQSKTVIQPMSAAKFLADGANQFRTANIPAAPMRSSPRRRPRSATKTGHAPIAS